MTAPLDPTLYEEFTTKAVSDQIRVCNFAWPPLSTLVIVLHIRISNAQQSAALAHSSTPALNKGRDTDAGATTKFSSRQTPLLHAVQAPISTDEVSSNLSILSRECARVLRSLRSHSFAWRASVGCLAALHCVWTMLMPRRVYEVVTHSRMIA